MSSYQVDLTNCDKEPIHIPGKIQSHGFLVAVNSQTQIVNYISENIAPFITEAPKNFLGKPIDEFEKSLPISVLQLNSFLYFYLYRKVFCCFSNKRGNYFTKLCFWIPFLCVENIENQLFEE